jgi:hypothetical protein
MIRHSGSARDPLPPGGYHDGRRDRTSPMAWLILAAVVVGLGAVVATGMPSGVTSLIAGALGSQG